MLLSLVLHTYSMRYVLPAAVMMGTAPTYVLAWGAWRLLSALLPARFYRELDDRFYTIYQSMVLFFFERYTGVQHGGIYVKRSARFNEKEMRNKLWAQVKAETPMYLVIFPEGTRYNPEMPKVIADSQLFADKEGLAVLKHVLTPRVKATHVAIDSMKNYLDAVYDVTVAYEGTVDHKGQRKVAPSMTEFLCKECPKVHIYLDRIELKDIPEEQMYMRRWLHERFEIKDKLLIEFYDAKDSKRRNKFPGKCVHSKLSLKKTLPSLLFLGGLTASMLLTESGRKLYVKTWIYGTLIGYLWVSVKA
ncbi:1-acyl-sn-glycerol-3-phosphate acyltransferase epsilon isoform X2 [Terrapene carolina triunguis]|uniref:1-acyl-sn-glycerol-3-phosphate acyltransferase epsilon isoform X1 n=1 Tax=Chrysemys picta bellii TaxID=8478 RepID=UPI000388C124|nr:1-acyl-sn-glycerol-3-phosphate acyltransferase epsilon isoform X3 [Chrysemys picta bellii]XP_024078644.1 1-acyl-sn-glycerol-3-phosphate acyltransferase epsilon isoform X2 [Terrapene carolina triunguis]